MDKPAFDDSKPFVPADSGDKPPFDPNAAFAPAEEPSILQQLMSTGKDYLNKYDSAKKAALSGITQGATLGLGDEIGAGIGAAGEKALETTGVKDDSGRSLHDMYREYQQLLQNKYKDEKNEHPLITTAGELAGGLLPAAIPGLQGEALAAEAPPIARLANAGMTGVKMAGLGAVAATGGSNNNLDNNPMGLANDATQGAELGGALGAGGNLLGQGAQLAGKAVDKLGINADNPFVRQSAKAYQAGKQFLGFGGDAARNRVMQDTNDVATGITKDLSSGFGKINEQYGQTLADHSSPIELDSDSSKSFSDIASAISDGDIKLPKSDAVDITTRLEKLMSGEMSAPDAKELQKDLYSMGAKVDGPMQGAFSNATSSINDALTDQVPGYAKVNSSFKDARTIPESVISKAPGEVNQTYMSDMSKPDQATFQGMKNVTQNAQTAGTNNRPAKEALLNLQNTLDGLQDSNPEVLKTLGIDPDTIMSKIKNQGDLDSIMQAIQGHNPHGGIMSQVMGTAKGGAYRTANWLGKATGYVGKLGDDVGYNGPMQSTSKLVDNGHSLYTAEPEALSSVAEKLKANPSVSHLGTSLNDSLSSKNGNMKNAALFSIMQNPTARKVVFGDDGSNSNQGDGSSQ